MPENGTIEDLPLHPIVSKIGTASYHLAKYLAKVLSPLSKSEYTVNNTTDFLKSIRNLKIPNNHKVISFDVKALFTNVPLDYTINLILRRIYDNHEIDTNISKKEMKDLLILCTKNVHFSFNGNIYRQCDGAAMGSVLGPTLAGIFMVELERSIVPKLSEHMMPWKRFVDDTITCIKTTSIPHVIKVLNTFHGNIQFTYEEERDGKIPFLDVLLIRKNDAFETAIYRKPTNKCIYLHWNSFAPETWKRGTLRSIINRAYDICSSDEFLRLEFSRIKHDFIKINGYPYWVFNQIYQNVIKSREISAKKLNSINDSATETIVSENTKKLYTIS